MARLIVEEWVNGRVLGKFDGGINIILTWFKSSICFARGISQRNQISNDFVRDFQTNRVRATKFKLVRHTASKMKDSNGTRT